MSWEATRRQDLGAQIPWNRALQWLRMGVLDVVSWRHVFGAFGGHADVERWS